METRQTKRLITAEEKDGLFIVRTAGQDDITIKLADLTEEILHAAMVHGLKQKIVDAAALGRDEVTGKPASPEAKYAEMRKVADNLIAGVWNGGRTGGGGGDNLTIRAIALACRSNGLRGRSRSSPSSVRSSGRMHSNCSGNAVTSSRPLRQSKPRMAGWMRTGELEGEGE